MNGRKAVVVHSRSPHKASSECISYSCFQSTNVCRLLPALHQTLRFPLDIPSCKSLYYPGFPTDQTSLDLSLLLVQSLSSLFLLPPTNNILESNLQTTPLFSSASVPIHITILPPSSSTPPFSQSTVFPSPRQLK